MIGVGVKNSTSDLLIANCDEFIFYDDLVREKKRPAARARAARRRRGGEREAGGEGRRRRGAAAPRRRATTSAAHEALDLIVETLEALATERGDEEKIWGSMVKQALKRRKPGFNESYYGFRSFNALLEEAETARQPHARARREVGRLHRPAAGQRRLKAA